MTRSGQFFWRAILCSWSTRATSLQSSSIMPIKRRRNSQCSIKPSHFLGDVISSKIVLFIANVLNTCWLFSHVFILSTCSDPLIVCRRPMCFQTSSRPSNSSVVGHFQHQTGGVSRSPGIIFQALCWSYDTNPHVHKFAALLPRCGDSTFC